MRHRCLPFAVVMLFALTGFSGCLDSLFGPSYQVERVLFKEGAWNNHNEFLVRVTHDEPVNLRVDAKPLGGGLTLSEIKLKEEAVQLEGSSRWTSEVTLTIPDGVWDLSYVINGKREGGFRDVRIDTTPPEPMGLLRTGNAVDGSYTLSGVTEEGAAVWVRSMATGEVVARALPHRVSGLADGSHGFVVEVLDRAGNWYNATVWVRAGAASSLPDGSYDFGVVARYTNELRIWDLTDLSRYVSRGTAAVEVGQAYLGSGYGITPGDSEVKRVVDQVVSPGMNTVEVAMALFEWLYDNLEYDESRLDSQTLMLPRQVILDSEDPDGEACEGCDMGEDGLADDGAGNGVRGGVCRDLAALYVSLLRAAGVPARLVSGYLAGVVQGFHAWVEFYGGSVGDQEPWIAVDVSPVDGPYSVGGMLQSFGIQHPDYLPLRALPPSSEVDGWSTALGVRYSYRGAQPEIDFAKSVETSFDVFGVLCVNQETLARAAFPDDTGCKHPTYTHIYGNGGARPDFLRRTERTIDYGIDVIRAGKGDRVTAEVAYPFAASVTPSQVEHFLYGPTFGADGEVVQDAQKGKATVTFTV